MYLQTCWKNIFRKSLVIAGVFGVCMTLIAEIFARPFAGIFVGYDEELLAMTTHGLRINSISFLFCGFNIFASAFFTALGNGGISLLISFARMFFCQIVAVLTLPLIFGLDGVWAAMIVAEVVTLILSVVLFIIERKKYGYA